MNMSERHRELIILIILTSSMLAIILNTTYSNLTVQWLFYQIPAFLLLMISPTWRTALVAILTSQIAKAFFTLASGPINQEIMINLALSMFSNIVVYCVVAYFLILLNKKNLETEELKKQIEEEKESVYNATVQDIKKSKKRIIDSMLDGDDNKKC